MKLIVLQGRFVKDPEMKQTKTGKSVATFTLAVQEYKKDAEYFCNAWEQTAKFICDYMKKGYNCIVEGTPYIETYEDDAGKKRKAFKVTVNKITPLFSGKKDDNKSDSDSEPAFTDDDIPF